MTTRCDNCAYFRIRVSHYYNDLTCLMGEKPSERPIECDFYEPKEVMA